MKVKDQVVIVTGSGRGIGESIALAFLSAGAKVVLSDIDGKLLEKIVGEAAQNENNILTVEADISKEKDVNHMIRETIIRFKKVDVLVNNAGIAKSKLIVETLAREWDRILSVNLKGTFLCSKGVAKEMIKRKRGRIINIASNASRIPRIELGAYCASKAAAVQFTRVLALELAEYGITVNAICPGATDTELLKNVPAQIDEMIHGNLKKFRCGIPLGKLAETKDIAFMVLYLASELGKHITGETIYIDGGQSIV